MYGKVGDFVGGKSLLPEEKDVREKMFNLADSNRDGEVEPHEF